MFRNYWRGPRSCAGLHLRIHEVTGARTAAPLARQQPNSEIVVATSGYGDIGILEYYGKGAEDVRGISLRIAQVDELIVELDEHRYGLLKEWADGRAPEYLVGEPAANGEQWPAGNGPEPAEKN